MTPRDTQGSRPETDREPLFDDNFDGGAIENDNAGSSMIVTDAAIQDVRIKTLW